MNPPIITLLPSSTRIRVEIFNAWAGVARGLIAVGVALVFQLDWPLQSAWAWEWVWGWLHLQGADVDAPVKDPSITALIVQRRRSEVRVARVDGRAAGQQVMGEGRAAVVLERAEDWIGVDLVASTVRKPPPLSLLRL